LTIPLCVDCNSAFGRILESPVSKIFVELERGFGLTDYEAELLVRWLWKFEGLSWCFSHPNDNFSEHFSLRDRVLNPIDDIRRELVLAVSLIQEIDPSYGDAPMGLDSWNNISAVYVAGVFSKVALMVALTKFENDIPTNFSRYRFADTLSTDRSTKLFFPQAGFQNCTDAVFATLNSARYLSYAHELDARNASY